MKTETEIKNEIMKLLDESEETDYSYDGEDEVPFQYTDKYAATDKIFKFISENFTQL